MYPFYSPIFYITKSTSNIVTINTGDPDQTGSTVIRLTVNYFPPNQVDPNQNGSNQNGWT